jgi:predicted outer membrane repeat protein
MKEIEDRRSVAKPNTFNYLYTSMPPNKLYPLIILLFISFSGQAQTIIPGGYVSGIWDATGSPYLVQGNITVHDDSSLIILAGVEVKFDTSGVFLVNGFISAVGNATDSIRFGAEYPGWAGMMIADAIIPAGDSIRLSYCIFSDGASPWHGGALYIHNTNSVSIDNCLFVGNDATYHGGALYIANANILCRNSKFTGNDCTGPGIGEGGAVYMLDSDPVFKEVLFYDNHASICGALYANYSSPSISSCTFEGNSSEGGGGALVCHNGGQFLIENSYFMNNHANGSGGAIAFLEGIHTQIVNCTITENISESEIYLSDGGGILITPYDNEISFVNCNISGNWAEDFGGGLYTASPTQLIGCLFHGNMMPSLQESRGGAIMLGETSMQLINTTFVDNYALIGTTIYCEDAELAMINNILWDNPGGSESKIFLSTYVNPPVLFVDHSNIQGGMNYISGSGGYMLNWASGNINEAPQFMLPGEDFSLAWNSPCINAGRSDTLFLLIPPDDIAGNPRIMGGEIDMGCYEYQGSISISEISIEQDFLVYPNPAGDYIYLKSETEIDFIGTIILTDFSGRILLSRKINISSGELIRQTLNGLPSGFYILNLLSNEHSYAKKLIIK